MHTPVVDYLEQLVQVGFGGHGGDDKLHSAKDKLRQPAEVRLKIRNARRQRTLFKDRPHQIQRDAHPFGRFIVRHSSPLIAKHHRLKEAVHFRANGEAQAWLDPLVARGGGKKRRERLAPRVAQHPQGCEALLSVDEIEVRTVSTRLLHKQGAAQKENLLAAFVGVHKVVQEREHLILAPDIQPLVDRNVEMPVRAFLHDRLQTVEVGFDRHAEPSFSFVSIHACLPFRDVASPRP